VCSFCVEMYGPRGLIEKKAQELEQEERDCVNKSSSELSKQQQEPVESTREMTKGGRGGGRTGKPASQQPKASTSVAPQTSNTSKEHRGKEKLVEYINSIEITLHFFT